MKSTRLIFVIMIILGLSLNARAEVPKMINYQGKLTTTEGACLDTAVSMQFSIYTDSIGGDQLWAETQLFVVVTNGIFNVLLGSVDSIPDSVFTGEIRYLGVKVGEDPEMTPRKAIVTVAYAYRTSKADTAQYARTAAPDDDWDTDTSGLKVYRLTGNVGIGEMPEDSCKLFVQSDSMVGDYAIYARGGTGLKAISTAWEGTGIQGEGGHAGVEGNGYIGVLGKGFWGGWFNGMGYFSGNVGIGTTEPDENLEVDGNAHITGDLTVDGSINSISLKVYDSGWFAAGAGYSYDLTHGLGTTKLLIQVFFSTEANGANAFLNYPFPQRQPFQHTYGPFVEIRNSLEIRVLGGHDYAGYLCDQVGSQVTHYAWGYYRVIAIALE